MNKIIQCLQSRSHVLWRWWFWMLLVLMLALSGSLIRDFFLNSCLLNEKSLPTAVALFNVCSRVACLCLSYLSFSLPRLHHFPSSSYLISSTQQRVPSVSSFPSVPFVYCFLKSCLCLFLLRVSLFLALGFPVALVRFLSLYLDPIVPSCLWLTVL